MKAFLRGLLMGTIGSVIVLCRFNSLRLQSSSIFLFLNLSKGCFYSVLQGLFLPRTEYLKLYDNRAGSDEPGSVEYV